MKVKDLIRGCIFSYALVAGIATYAESTSPQVIGPGEYRCWTPREIVADPSIDSREASKLVSGFCKYRGRGINGKHAFRKLDTIPQRIIKRDAPNVVSYMEPRTDTSEYTITWWLEGDDPDVLHPANHVIGRHLQQADVAFPLTRVPVVEIRAMIFSLDQTKEREIGFDIAANLVKTPGSNVGPFDNVSVDVAAGQGLLNIVGGLADPLANAIQLGFSLSSDKSYAKEQLAINTLCPLGEFCQFEDLTKNYIMTPTGSENAMLGIRYTMRPLMGVEEGEIKIEDLEFYLGLKTDDPLAPVNFIKPINFHTYILKDGELHILGSEIREFDANGTHLLGKDRKSVHSRMILLISASLRKGEGEDESSGVFSARPIDRSFSPPELATLDQQAGFYDVLNSFEVVCFDDVMSPLREERICGFQLTRMNPDFVDYWVDISIDPRKSLKYAENQVRAVKLGDIYQGKGYYQIPMMAPGKARRVMNLTMELSEGGSGDDLRDTFKSRKIPVGIEVEFAHTSGHSDPVDVRRSSVKPVK